ncbi:MAG: right-handed parallel beta-helix repeat-containing protein [Acidobacteria bacterium]|nr:right-handed parallel beta-helix repeat-containing protein [Acidobacteriota bacterium]
MFGSLKLIRINAVSAGQASRQQVSAEVTLKSSGKGNPWINFKDGRDLRSSVEGAGSEQMLMSDAKALALASGDIDGDGVADIASSYQIPGGGLLMLHRGNADAIYPNAPAAQMRKAQGTFTDAPFLSPARVMAVPLSPDFLGIGDFNADGHQDIAMASRSGSQICWLTGDGIGGFSPPEFIDLPGIVTAMTVSEINRADGLLDVMVTVIGPQGAQLMVFESPEGALSGEPERIAIPYPATSMVTGYFDDDSDVDLSVAAGHVLMIIHGRDRKLASDKSLAPPVRPPVVEPVELPWQIESLAAGHFTGDPRMEISLLARDGVMRVMKRRAAGGGWGELVGSIQLNQSLLAARDRPAKILATKVSSRPFDDLIVLDQNARQLHLVMSEAIIAPQYLNSANLPETADPPREIVSLEITGEPAAVLPMRLNADALSDLVVLKDGGETSLTVSPSAPMKIFTVNSDIQYQDYTPGDGKCETPPSTGRLCTLYAAIQEANASPGADQINFSINKTVYGTIFGGGGTHIGETVTIDGTSQGHVEIYGNGHTVGLSVYGTNTTIRGMALNRYSTKAIALGDSGHIIEGNYVGTDATGSQIVGTAGSSGIYVNGSDHTIGGTTAAAGNVISGFPSSNIEIDTDFDDKITSGIKILGNFIGTNSTGTEALGTTTNAIEVFRGLHITIGGTAARAGNLIAGNRQVALISLYSGESTLIQGNKLGTDATGMAALGTGGASSYGINVAYAIDNGVTYLSQKNTIGGTTPASRNLISACPYYGINISRAKENNVRNNLIGTNLAGTAALANGYGIQVIGAEALYNDIGGVSSDTSNVISGNKNNGISIYSNNNTVSGNYIGTQINGTSALKNGGYGIALYASAASNSIGLSPGTPNEKPNNVIAFNGSDGIYVDASVTKTLIRSNSIFDNDGLGIKVANSSAPQPPVINVSNILGKIQVDGTLTGQANTTYAIEYFGNDACDPSGSGEGKNLLGWHEVTTNGSGMVNFTAPFNPPSGVIVTATAALSSEGTTSQFSVCGGSAGDKVLVENPRVDGVNSPNETLLPRPATPTNISFMGDIRFRLTSDNNGGYLIVAAYDVSIPNNPLSLQKPNGDDARIVIPVQMSAGEQLQKDVQLDIRIPSVSSRIQIRVGLFDSNTSTPALLAVDAIGYVRSNVKIELGTRDTGEPDTAFKPWPGTKRLLANKWIDAGLDIISGEIMLFRVTYDLSSSNGTLYLEKLGKKKGVPGAVGATSNSAKITGGRQKQVFIYVFNQEVLANSDFWEWRAHIVTDVGNEEFYSEPEEWTIDRLKLLAHSPPTTLSFTRGNDVEIGYSLEYNADRPSSRLTGVVEIQKDDGTTEQKRHTLADFAKGDHGVTPPGSPGKFTFTLPINAVSFNVTYTLSSPPDCNPYSKDCATYAKPDLAYNKIASPAIQIPAGITGVASALGVDLTNVQNQINRTEKFVRNGSDFVSTALSNPKLILISGMAHLEAMTEKNAGVAELQNLIGVNAVWQFDPPIPADGTFGADLTLHYGARDLPDDPNFNEANLKIIAFYPETGRIEVLPTTLDLANKKATTRVNGLASYYTLAVTGPFPARRLNFPVINSTFNPGLTFINPTAGSANLTVNDYGPVGSESTGNPAPAGFTIPSLRQVVKAVTDLFQVSNDSGWMQATSTAGPVIGYETYGDTGRQDGLAIPAVNWPRLILPDIELDSAWTTEIHLANTANFNTNLRLELHSSNGSLAGTYETSLGAKGALADSITEFFPNLTAPFKGYLLVSSDQRLAAAGLLISANSIATTSGQLWQSGSDTPVKLFGPQVLAGSGGTAELTLVNPTTSAATLTLRLLNETGGNVGAPVSRTLNSGEQQRLDVGQLFGLNSGTAATGGLVVESSISGIVGELGLRDSATGNNYRTILPLEGTPSRAIVFAQVSNQSGSFTRLSFFNPGDQQANVMVKVMRADGSEAGSTTIQMPAKGAVTRLLSQMVGQSAGQSGGYVIVTADQSIVASGTFGQTDNSSLSSLPGQQVELTVQACTTFTSLSSTSGTPGSAVTITGSGFTGVSSVKFSNNASATFTIVNDTTITTTVPYSAATGPITISKSGCTDVLTSVYTVNTANCIRASISGTLSGNSGGSLTVPITVTDLTGKGVIAYDGILNYDPAVLRPLSNPVDNASTISGSMSVIGNVATPGEIRISAYGSQVLTGAGTLLNLKFDIIGNIAACSDLSFSLIRFNEGEPCAAATNGRFCVSGRTISGTVNYCAAATPVKVPGVTVNLTGASTGSITTDSVGKYVLSNLGAGPYTLTPAKSGSVNGINSYDAALVAQHAVGLITLSDCQRTAGDASNDGSLSSFDAAMIAQYAVGITNQQSMAGTWKFSPVNRSYPTLTADQLNQDFNAILVGDVSGNWAAPNLQLAAAKTVMAHRESTRIFIPEFDRNPEPGSVLIVPITVDGLAGSNAISYDFEMSFDQSVLEFKDAAFNSTSTLSREMAITVNPGSGNLRVSAFGTRPIAGSGTLLNLRFRVTGKSGRSTSLAFRSFTINEALQSRLEGSKLIVGRKRQERLNIDP